MNTTTIAQEAISLLNLNPPVWQLQEMIAACNHVIDGINEKGGSWRVAPHVKRFVGAADPGLIRQRFVDSLEVLAVAMTVASELESESTH